MPHSVHWLWGKPSFTKSCRGRSAEHSGQTRGRLISARKRPVAGSANCSRPALTPARCLSRPVWRLKRPTPSTRLPSNSFFRRRRSSGVMTRSKLFEKHLGVQEIEQEFALAVGKRLVSGVVEEFFDFITPDVVEYRTCREQIIAHVGLFNFQERGHRGVET